MKMLQEDNGNTSTMRWCVIISTLSACGVAILGVWRGVDMLGLGALVSGMLGVTLGAKAYQKRAEK